MTTIERADAGPYADRERLLDELVRIDLCLRRYLESRWAARDGHVDELRGLYVSDAEVDRLLSVALEDRSTIARTPSDASERAAFEGRIKAVRRHIETRLERTEEAGSSTRLGELTEAFELDRDELDVLLCALAPDIDDKYETIYGYLRDDATRHRPTVGLLLSVLCEDRTEQLATRAIFEPGSTLLDSRLLSVSDGATSVSRSVSVPRRIASYLLGGDDLPSELAAASIETADRTLDSIAIEDRTRLEALVETMEPDRTPRLIAFVGPDEASAADAAAAICAATDRPLIGIDAIEFFGEQKAETIALLGRELRLRDGVLRVRGIGAIADAEGSTDAGVDPVESLLLALDELPGDAFLTGDADLTARIAPRLSAHAFERFEFPRPSCRRREAIWADVADLPAAVDPGELASRYRFTRGQLEDAVSTARSIAGGELTPAAIRSGCRAHSTANLAELATEIEPGYGWDDIVLPPDALASLREAAIYVRHRGTVFEEWGFEDRFSHGNGVALLFTGPSGTGKTMAAEVIANDAGLPLFVLDLAAVTSKYVGETEKNLRRVFDAAEQSNAILFFDEADALFGERSDVSDAHDRYANVEIDYLLQRMERHDGCLILASNLDENIDDAFLRRINLSVSFPRPDRTARAEIWRGVFPAETPLEAIDVSFLSTFELTGGNIRNVATTAAFLAAEEGTAVGMEHLTRALSQELQKIGHLFDRTDFGPYRDCLPTYE